MEVQGRGIMVQGREWRRIEDGLRRNGENGNATERLVEQGRGTAPQDKRTVA